MASAIIHICVAKQVNEVLRTYENELFLGSIAPDISKQIGKSKRHSHFLANNKTDIPNVKEFYKKYRKDLTNPFTMGYYIHLLTDKYWYKGFLSDIVTETTIKQKDGSVLELDHQSISKMIYNDYTNLNTRLIEYYNLSLDIFFNEIQIPTTKITEIPIKDLNIIVEKMGLIIQNSKKGKTLSLDYQRVLKFIEECSNQIIQDLLFQNLLDYKV